MSKKLDEIHPGEILLEEFMRPMGISARQLAADIDVSPSRISEIVNGALLPLIQLCGWACFSAWSLGSG